MPRPELTQSVIQQESGGDPTAVSPKGAVGLMQIMPDTARDFGTNPADLTNPAVNVQTGNKILDSYIQREGGERAGLIAYNEGPGKYERGLVIPASANYADRVLQGRNGPASVDQQYAARQVDNKNVADGRAWLAEHPELLRFVRPEPPPAKTPPAGVPTASQEALSGSGAISDTIENVATKAAEA